MAELGEGKWFKDIAPQEMPDLAGRLWWSFYESDAQFEIFLNRALCYVGELDEQDVRTMPWNDREALLFQHLNDTPYLVVLDEAYEVREFKAEDDALK